MKIDVRDLVHKYYPDTILTLPDTFIEVIFYDKTIPMTREQIFISWYYWEFFRKVPNAPILSKFSVHGSFTTKTHKQIMCIIDHVEQYRDEYDIASYWELYRLYCVITSALYNMTVDKMADRVISTSLEDIAFIQGDKRFVGLMDAYQTAINDALYDPAVVSEQIALVNSKMEHLLYNVLPNEEKYKNNGVIKMCLAQVLNKGQLLQLFTPRGNISDINGKIFPYPIDTSYVEGLNNLYDLIESRAASVALMAVKSDLQMSEYFRRKAQLVTLVICDVIREGIGEVTIKRHNPYPEAGRKNIDITMATCTDWETISWKVEDKHETLLRGKVYMDDVTGEAKLVSEHFDDLIGKVIQLRTLTKCGYKDPQKVCETCMGLIHRTLPPTNMNPNAKETDPYSKYTNPGGAFAQIILTGVIQKIIGTKHHEHSKVSTTLDLSREESEYVSLNHSNKHLVMLSPNAAKKRILVSIPRKYAHSLNEINSINLDYVSHHRMSNCNEVSMCLCNKDGEPRSAPTEINLSINGKGAHLSHELLGYLKKNSWKNTNDLITFVLEDWDINEPLFDIPHVSTNMRAFVKQVEEFILPISTPKSKRSEKKSIISYKTVDKALLALVNILESHIVFNMAHAEILIRGAMCYGESGEDFSLPRAKEPFRFESYSQIIERRSLSALLLYEGQCNNLKKPYYYIPQVREVYHPYDVIFLGDDAIEAYRNAY